LLYDLKVKKKPSAEDLERKRAFLFSVKVLAPAGIIGGIASYITNNMGPLLNVYLVSLDLDKYAMVGTRSGIFISVNAVKLALRMYKGDLPTDDLPLAFALGGVGVVGVVFAKIWLKHASPRVFKFVFEKVTLSVVSLTGTLLVCGWDMKALAKLCWDSVQSIGS